MRELQIERGDLVLVQSQGEAVEGCLALVDRSHFAVWDGGAFGGLVVAVRRDYGRGLVSLVGNPNGLAVEDLSKI